MKKFNYVLLLSFVFLLIAGCSKLDTQPDLLNSSDDVTLKKGKKHPVPFKSKFAVWGVSEVPIFSDDPEIVDPIGMHLIVEGSGNATHMGKTKLIIDEDFYFMPPPNNFPLLAVITFISANKDEVYADFTGYIVPTFPNITIYGEGIINGGTGRFEDANGILELNAKFDTDLGEGESFFTGEIMY